jgi:glutaredoxin
MMAKAFLQANNLPYEENFVDMFSDEQMNDLVKKANGSMVLPIIFVDDKVFTGMDFRKIKELL